MIQSTRTFTPLLGVLTLAGVLCLLPSLALADGLALQSTGGNADGSPDIESLSDLGITLRDGAAELSLDRAIQGALQRNLSLDVQRLRSDQTRLGLESAYGIYDLNLTVVGGFNSDTTPPSSTLQAASIITTDVSYWNNSLTQLTPYGGTASLEFNNSELTFSDQNLQPNPRSTVGLDLNFTQPLWRGFGKTVTEQGLIIARNDNAISREDFQLQVEAVVADVVFQYWSLVEAREQLTVAEESLGLAKELHEMNRIQVEVGTKAPLEMVQSEVGVATREEDIIRLTATVEDAADNLRHLLNLNRGDLWRIPLVPMTDPETEHQPIELRAAVDEALEHRPDLRRLKISNGTLGVLAEVAENSVKPRLDLFVEYGFNGLAGDVNLPGVMISAGYTDALQHILDADFEGWTLQATFAMPIQNRKAKAESARADLAVDEGNALVLDLQQSILTEVRRSARAVETAAKQIDSARVSSKLADRNLDAERKRYENGLSTSFQVLEIQEDLSNARSREVSAVINYRQALSRYHQALGLLLDENDIEIAAAE